jgi:hypothetical protein
MARAKPDALLQYLRRMIGPRVGGLADAHLLERFVNEGDEAAFEVLVWRHGPMDHLLQEVAELRQEIRRSQRSAERRPDQD